MPTYEYKCRDCGHQLDVVQAFSDDPLTECPSCAGNLRKVFSPVGIAFKGSGFYKTDNRGGSSTSASSGSSSGDGAGSSSSGSSSSSDSGSSSSGSSSSGSSSSGSSSSGSSSSGSSGSGSSPSSDKKAKAAS